MTVRVGVYKYGKSFYVEVTEPYYNCGRSVIMKVGPFRKQSRAKARAKQLRSCLRREAHVSPY